MSNIQTILEYYILFAFITILVLIAFTKMSGTGKLVRFLMITIMFAVICMVGDYAIKISLEI